LIYRVNMLMALVNSLYAPFNINIVVVQLEIWEHDRSHLKVEEHHLLATLAQFKRMHTTVRHDCLHALLGIKDEASRTRGKANPQTMCVYSRCVGYSRDSPRIEIAETARTIAHELGHNFGLRHDTEECKCQRCIMATGVEFGNNILEWSPCSIQDMPTLLAFGMGVCLGDAPVRSIVSVSSVLANESAEVSTRGRNEPHTNPIAPAASVVHVYNWMKQLTPLAAVHQTHSTRKRRRHPSDVRAQLKAAGLCGNGQLDPGEECDCGSSTSCPPELRDCCDVDNCRLRAGSECAGGSCCTVEPVPEALRSIKTRYRCRLLAAGTVCRNASGNCDLPEYCDGRSQWCPADVYKADGIPCRTEEGQRSHCIRGGCRTADSWCRTLWGDKARRGSPDCFYENHLWNMGDKPDPVANCGKYRPPQSERWEDAKSWPGLACQSWQDAECGRLWCDHRNEKAMLLGWIDSRTRVLRSGEVCSALVYDPVWPAADPSTWHVDNNTVPGQHNLNSAGVGIFSANTQDAGMVPDGTPCSHGMCYNGTCTNVYEIPSRIECDCRGQGVCNNRGNCHCNPGFSPPNCDYGGDGGSVDSGPPPPDGSPKPILVIPLCLLTFIGLPLVVALIYWYRNYGCTCPRVIGVSMIPTESGLYKPFDRGAGACIRQCCRCKIRPRSIKGPSYLPATSGSYPILAYATNGPNSLKNGGWVNGHCVTVVGKANGTCLDKAINGDVGFKANGTLLRSAPAGGQIDSKSKRKAKKSTKSDMPDLKGLISGPLELGEAQSVRSMEDEPQVLGGDSAEPGNPLGTNRMAKMWENVIARQNRVQVGSAPLADAPDTVTIKHAPIVNKTSVLSSSDGLEPKSVSVVQISQPKLETMTYQGDMCSLNEAMSTLKRGEKHSKMHAAEHQQQQQPTSASTIRRTATLRPPVRLVPSVNPLTSGSAGGRLVIQPTVNRSQSQRFGLSPRDISNPRLQNTTYTEALTDLETVRQQRAQQPTGGTLTNTPDKTKSNSRRP
uniref:Peptidase M12B domain-containing protein n=1 Tax=Echinostoma caproni TaxID=27848 RepID=A0A183A863_9TREM